MRLGEFRNPTEAETRCFISALTRIFQGESWEAVRPYAECAWAACGLAEDRPWTQVEAFVRAEWERSPEPAISE